MPKDAKRPELRVWVTDEELKRIERAAAIAKQPVATWLREIVLAAARMYEG